MNELINCLFAFRCDGDVRKHWYPNVPAVHHRLAWGGQDALVGKYPVPVTDAGSYRYFVMVHIKKYII